MSIYPVVISIKLLNFCLIGLIFRWSITVFTQTFLNKILNTYEKSLSSLIFLRLCNKDCHCKRFNTTSVNISVKYLLPSKFKCNFEPFRWRSVIVFLWPIVLMFFRDIKLSNADLLLTHFKGTDHCVLLDLKLKSDMCLFSVLKRYSWKFLLAVPLMVDFYNQSG